MMASISILTHKILYNPDRCFILRPAGRLTTLLHRASSPFKTSEQTSNPSREKASIDSFHTQLTFHLPSASVLLQPSLPKHRSRFTPKHQAHTRYPPHHPKQSEKVEQPRNSPTRNAYPSRSRLPISSPPSSRPPARTHIATKTHISRLKPRDRQAAQRDESCTKNC
jgi:hypothetical protein